MKKLIIIVGPTGSSKSELSFKIAKYLNTEILVADAFQVYKELNAGINKPSDKELNEIKHHFVNSISMYDQWNVNEFQKEFKKIVNNNKLNYFVVEGGSNLYIDSIIKNYDFKTLGELPKDFENQSNEFLWNELKQKDEQEANKIPVQNRKRILQALRIIYGNNQKKSLLDINNKPKEFETFLVWKKLSREHLYNKLDKRTEQMFEKQNWVNEVKELLNKDKNILEMNSFKAIGYIDVANSILNNTDLDIETIKRKVRNYAKRQETWIRNKFDIDFIYESENDWEKLIEQCKNFISK